MTPEEQIDCECFVCPYCKYEHRQGDPYGYEFSDENFECGNCSKKFIAEVSALVMYKSTPIEQEEE